MADNRPVAIRHNLEGTSEQVRQAHAQVCGYVLLAGSWRHPQHASRLGNYAGRAGLTSQEAL
jgi:hypothetical protein